jgi:hypothetical protein
MSTGRLQASAPADASLLRDFPRAPGHAHAAGRLVTALFHPAPPVAR